MQEYYELTNANGNTSFYYVSNPTKQMSIAVQDLLMHECLSTQVMELYMNHINLKNYLLSLTNKLENKVLVEIIEEFLQEMNPILFELKVNLSAQDLENNELLEKTKELRKSWKKDLHFARSTQIMTGYLLNFSGQVENLTRKMDHTGLLQLLERLNNKTLHFHETINQISLHLINHKFIHN